jgi:hypothetical protein
MAIGLFGSGTLITSCGEDNDGDAAEVMNEIDGIENQLGLEVESEYENDGLLELGEYNVVVPKEWIGEKPANGMRVAQYKIPNNDEVSMYVTKLPKNGMMGDMSDPSVIMDKWKAEFSGAEETMDKNFDSGAVMYATDGMYTHTDMATGNATSYDDYMMLGGFLPGRESIYTFKMVGPKAAVAEYTEKFEEMMESITLVDEMDEDELL